MKFGFRFAALTIILASISATSFTATDTLPNAISDSTFWRMLSDFSEDAGSFRFEYMSNEREFQFVIPELKKITKPGGVYLGVGPEQNFTYIAAVQPKMAFIFDIRRQNMLEHLMYKAIFEMSANRIDFISRLFARKSPAGLNENSTAKGLFLAYRTVEADENLFKQNLKAIKDRLIKDHHFALTRDDEASLDFIYKVFFDSGPGVDYPRGSFGFGFGGAGYADLMAATDEQGQPRSYLATEENFQLVRELEKKNLIIPVVGDFAGTKALRTVANYLKGHNATVAAFYTSNVEQYLFQQDEDWRHFFSNVATLPTDASSTFIRSSHFAYGSNRRQITRQLGGGNFVSLLCPMADLIKAFTKGEIDSYERVIQLSRP